MPGRAGILLSIPCLCGTGCIERGTSVPGREGKGPPEPHVSSTSNVIPGSAGTSPSRTRILTSKRNLHSNVRSSSLGAFLSPYRGVYWKRIFESLSHQRTVSRFRINLKRRDALGPRLERVKIDPVLCPWSVQVAVAHCCPAHTTTSFWHADPRRSRMHARSSIISSWSHVLK